MSSSIAEAFAKASAITKQHVAQTIPAEWDDEGETTITEVQTKERSMPKQLFTETTGTSRATFYFIKENPGLTRKQILTGLVERGHRMNTLETLLSNMIVQKLVDVDSQGGFTTVGNEYTPIKAYSAAKAQQARRHAELEAAQRAAERRAKVQATWAAKKAVKEEKAQEQEVKAAPPAAPVVENLAPHGLAALRAADRSVWSAENILDQIPIKQARALYDELKKIFG